MELLTALLLFGLIVFVWFLPILSILSSSKTSGNEKLAWILAVLFISWFAWIFYLLRESATFYMNGVMQGGGDLGLPTDEPFYEGNEPLYILISYEDDQFTVFGFLQEDEEEAGFSSFDAISLYLRESLDVALWVD